MNHFYLQQALKFATGNRQILLSLAFLSVFTTTVSAQCIDSSKIDVNAACIEIYKPVCGCNNVMYSNSCFADASGVLSYTDGACPVEDIATFFLVNAEITVCDTVEIGWNAKCKCAIDWSNYEAVSIQYNCANVIGNGKIVGLTPGVAEIRITELSTDITSTLFLMVVSADEPTSTYYLRYLPTSVTKDGKYTVSLFCKARLDCCNTHVLNANLTDEHTITLSVSSTKMNCPTQDVCTADLKTQITDLPQGEYYINYGIRSIFMQLGDTTSSQAYKLRPIKNILAVGESVAIKTVDNSAVNWSDYVANTSDVSIAKVSADGIIVGIKYGRAMISVKELSSGAYSSWDIWVDSNASYFTKDSIILLAGQTAILPINYAMQQDFILNDLNNAIAIIDTSTQKITALSVGSTYCVCHNVNTQTIDTLIIIVKDPLASETQITDVAVLDHGYTLEITFDRPVTLYEGIERDFVIVQDNSLKALTGYTVKNVSYKIGDKKTVVLIMETPVPVTGVRVQLQDLKSFTVGSHFADVLAAGAEIRPNPAKNIVTIIADGLINVQITTISGQHVVSARARNSRADLPVSHLPAGKYIVRCETATVNESLDLIIE